MGNIHILQYTDPATQRTEIAVNAYDIIGFTSHDNLYYIIVGSNDASWGEVSKECYEWMLEQWCEIMTK